LALSLPSYPLLAQSQRSDQNQTNNLRAVEQRLEEGRAQDFGRLTALRFAAGVFVNDSHDESASKSLISAITVPLSSIGIKLTEQLGQAVDSRLPSLVVIAQIACRASGDQCVLLLTASLSRDVQLQENPNVKFRADVWRKEHRDATFDASSSRAKVKELLTADMNEFVRYWAMANVASPAPR
jgi:hypothetical protein